MLSRIKLLWRHQHGDDLEEYALLLALIALAAAVMAYSFGLSNANTYTRANQSLSALTGGGSQSSGQTGGSGQSSGANPSGSTSQGGGQNNGSGQNGGQGGGGGQGGTVGQNPIPSTPLGQTK